MDPVLNDDETITFTLERPFEYGGKRYETVTIKSEADAGDLEAMDDAKGTIRKTQRLIAKLSEISIEKPGLKIPAVRKLKAVDYTTIAKVIGRIIGGKDPLGEDSEADDSDEDEGGEGNE